MTKKVEISFYAEEWKRCINKHSPTALLLHLILDTVVVADPRADWPPTNTLVMGRRSWGNGRAKGRVLDYMTHKQNIIET